MHLAAYLCTSRHGVFYFRWPIPTQLHPQGKRRDVKVSLGTKCPRAAKQMARVLAAAGHSLLSTPTVRRMKYDEIREHVRVFFRTWLARFKERAAERGPVDELSENALIYAQGFAEQDVDTWQMLYADGENGLLELFCRNRGLTLDDLTPDDRTNILVELQKGHRAYAQAALIHNSGLADLDLGDGPERPPEPPEAAPEGGPGYREIVERYFQEATRGGALAATTESSKRDALDLLGKITGDKPPSRFTRTDAQKVKEVLLRLPTNRNKSPLTRGLSLEKMLEVAGVQVISSRTVNVYIGAMQRTGRSPQSGRTTSVTTSSSPPRTSSSTSCSTS